MDNSKFKPYVDASSTMAEFSIRAIVIGLVMSVVLGAANAYLGLKAGMTIAATYPAAVIGMAVLRMFGKRGTILEENIARTIGSIGESVAAGAIFTLPAFIISGLWKDFSGNNYWICSAILLLGGFLGVLFVTVLRRVMVEDHELPFPESVAASEIHKAGQKGGGGAGILVIAMAWGALIQMIVKFKVVAAEWSSYLAFKPSGVELVLNDKNSHTVNGTGGIFVTTPGVSPAYMGVGFIIGPVLACLNFSGGLLAWGLFVPLIMWILGPNLESFLMTNGCIDINGGMGVMATQVWKLIVRPIAIGGMLVSAAYTLYNMRNNLVTGLVRAVNDLKKAAGAKSDEVRTERDLNFKTVFVMLLIASFLVGCIYYHFTGVVWQAILATIMMLILGFFFSAVSGYLVGLIGSSNNPISGLTIATIVIVAGVMAWGFKVQGDEGVLAVLGVAAVVCVTAAVAGEMFQDLKVGHILGGTPWRMQIGDLIGIVPAALVMAGVLGAMHQSDITMAQNSNLDVRLYGFGGKTYPAPQAGLMAMLAQGIVGGNMTWGLIIIGVIMGVCFILLKVKSPMLVSVGMYLPFETTAAIFLGGMVKWGVDFWMSKQEITAKMKESVENTGVLTASGLIAGEALTGLLFAFYGLSGNSIPELVANPSFGWSILVIIGIGVILAFFPIKDVKAMLAGGPSVDEKSAKDSGDEEDESDDDSGESGEESGSGDSEKKQEKSGDGDSGKKPEKSGDGEEKGPEDKSSKKGKNKKHRR